MRAELPTISFLCVVLLAALLPLRRVRCNVPNLAVVCWLLGTNLVQGINSLIWAGNVGIRVPVWCDIVTKLIVGASFGVPGAILCQCARLERISSPRQLSSNPAARRNRLLLEITACYIIPIIFMVLHIIVQDHRFDLIRDFGCFPSTNPSMPALILMWLPPLFICIISFVFCGLTVHHSFKVSTAQFACYVQERTTMTSGSFFRQLWKAFIMTAVLAIVSLFSMFSIPTLRPWVSWSAAHASMSQVVILTTFNDVRSAQMAWWGMPVTSIFYLFCAYTMGDEVRGIVEFVRDMRTRRRWDSSSMENLSTKTPKGSDTVSRASSLNKSVPRPLTLELKSGWDDTLDSKSKKGLARLLTRSPSPRSATCPSPTPSAGTSRSPTGDNVFMESTLSYLGSPPAKALGLTPRVDQSPISPPPIYTSPQQSTFESFSAVTPQPSKPRAVTPTRARQPIPEDVPSTISSVFDAPWPVPPPSPVPTTSSRHGRRPITRSRTNSNASSSADHTIGYPLCPTVTPPHLWSRPFQGSGIPAAPQRDLPPVPTTAKSISKRPSIRSLPRKWSRERVTSSASSAEIIYMTVVKETV